MKNTRTTIFTNTIWYSIAACNTHIWLICTLYYIQCIEFPHWILQWPNISNMKLKIFIFICFLLFLFALPLISVKPLYSRCSTSALVFITAKNCCLTKSKIPIYGRSWILRSKPYTMIPLSIEYSAHNLLASFCAFTSYAYTTLLKCKFL